MTWPAVRYTANDDVLSISDHRSKDIWRIRQLKMQVLCIWRTLEDQWLHTTLGMSLAYLESQAISQLLLSSKLFPKPTDAEFDLRLVVREHIATNPTP